MGFLSSINDASWPFASQADYARKRTRMLHATSYRISLTILRQTRRLRDKVSSPKSGPLARHPGFQVLDMLYNLQNNDPAHCSRDIRGTNPHSRVAAPELIPAISWLDHWCGSFGRINPCQLNDFQLYVTKRAKGMAGCQARINQDSINQEALLSGE